MRVLVIDKNKKPLDPTHPARARKLLKSGRAKVFCRSPFTIIMQDLEAENCVTHPHRLKIDPGVKTTEIAILQGSRVTDLSQELVRFSYPLLFPTKNP